MELQNFQSRKRLLEYDDVMNQQREVIYSLRTFALEGGEELKGEALKMVEKGIAGRVDRVLGEYESAEEWDLPLLQQELLLQYLLRIPELEDPDHRPTQIDDLHAAANVAAKKAFAEKLESLDTMRDENGQGFSGRLLALVMLQVLDDKWKDHLYDLDQLRNAIHYRSWGQRDPLVEYKQEAYTMFVDLMHDIYNTFTGAFLKAQLVMNEAPPPAPVAEPPRAAKPTKRYNAMGILEDIPDEDATPAGGASGTNDVRDVGPADSLKKQSAVRREPTIVGAGRSAVHSTRGRSPRRGRSDWSTVGRNDACPCGSGKKFKKCHGVGL